MCCASGSRERPARADDSRRTSSNERTSPKGIRCRRCFHASDRVRSDGLARADAPGGGPAAADGRAGSGHRHTAIPHDPGLHHAGRQPARRARPELSARLVVASRHASQRRRVPQRLALVRRRRRLQPGLGLRAIPVDSVREPAGLDHELGPTRGGSGDHVLGRTLLGSALSQPLVGQPASPAWIPPAAPRKAAPSSSTAAFRSTTFRTAAFRGATATRRPPSFGPAASASTGRRTPLDARACGDRGAPRFASPTSAVRVSREPCCSGCTPRCRPPPGTPPPSPADPRRRPARRGRMIGP